jgi:type I restriction enzyme S subunit
LGTYDFEGEYITWTTDGAYAGTVFYRSGRFNCTNVCGTLQAKAQDLNMQYLASALSVRTKKHVSYIGNPKLMNNVMAKIRVPVPPATEQHRIAAVLDAHDARIRAEEVVLAKRRQVKEGLMDDLLTGKVRVS